MIISNAQPIQFWLNGQTVYNNQEIPGMQSATFLQKFNSTDTIKIQLTDTVSSAYTLRVYDQDDILLGSVGFTIDLVNSLYVASCSFTFASLGISSEVVKLVIVSTSYNMSGALTDSGETIAGNLEQTTIFSVTGALTDSGETAAGNVEFSSSDSIDVTTTLTEAVTGSPNWRAVWSSGAKNATQNVTGSGTITSTVILNSSTVTCTVTRPSGVTLDVYDITWKLNGVNAPNPDGSSQANPQSGIAGETISFVYTYTGIIDLDSLAVEIVEG